MATYFGAIDHYTVNILSPEPFGETQRTMQLKGSFGVAYLVFHAEDANLPNNENWKIAGQDRFRIHYPVSCWQPILDVLRNESPVHFTFYEPNAAQIYTGDEPVGEEEAN